MIRHNEREQRTIQRPVEVEGIGYVTGATIRLRFVPADPSTGIVFVRTDLSPEVEIPATVDQVVDTSRRTTLGKGTGQISLVEHVLAALAGMRIDNCRVEINAPEPPGMDGSSQDFVDALLQAGVEHQHSTRPVWQVEEAIRFSHKGTTITLYPDTGSHLKATYYLDYGLHPSLRKHSYTNVITPETFRQRIAPCRTFILESEVEMLRAMGLGKNTSEADLLVYGKDGIIGNTERFADEPARHKVLDMIGDLALLGVNLCGHVIGYRTGHPQNVELVRLLDQQLHRERCAA